MKNRLNVVAPFCMLVSSAYATRVESTDHFDPHVFAGRIQSLEDYTVGERAWMPASVHFEDLVVTSDVRSPEAGKAWSFPREDSGVSLSSHARSRSIVVTAIVDSEWDRFSLREVDSPTIRAEVELLQLQFNVEGQ